MDEADRHRLAIQDGCSGLPRTRGSGAATETLPSVISSRVVAKPRACERTSSARSSASDVIECVVSRSSGTEK